MSDRKITIETIKKPIAFYCDECEILSLQYEEQGKGYYSITYRYEKGEDDNYDLIESNFVVDEVEDVYIKHGCIKCGEETQQFIITDKVFDVLAKSKKRYIDMFIDIDDMKEKGYLENIIDKNMVAKSLLN